MNHIYRVVFNRHTNTFQAVAETAKGQHKTHSSKQGKSSAKKANYRTLLLTPLTFCISLVSSTFAMASPTGGKVSAGQASISQSGNTTTIKQTSQNSAINWQKFSINNNETVNFNQPNATAITLNRVLGNEKSVINGALNANGKVFIQNPNGTLIGKNAQVNVGGLLATTTKISDDDFMAGKFKFWDWGGKKGTIENLGNIKVPKGGIVAFIAPVVKNTGKITAPQGKVLLASAENFTITLPNDSFSYTLDKGTVQGLVDNGGAILADGGRVVLTTKGVDSVKKSVLKHTGIIEANTVKNNNGVIELLGDLDNSELQLTGTIKAEGKGNAQGGFVETSASKLNIDDSAVVSTKAENGKTGTWLIDPKDFTVAKRGGDITGKQVSTALNKNNVTLKSADGKAEGKGDVIVNDEISWDKNKLTLSADNDIRINNKLNVNGDGKLNLKAKSKIIDVNLDTGSVNFEKAGDDLLTINDNEYRVINSLGLQGSTTGKDLQGIDGDLERHYALGADIDASNTKNWNNGKGFKPIGMSSKFTGSFNGLGHKINNLVIDRKTKDMVGLISNFKFGANSAGVSNFTTSGKILGDNSVGIIAHSSQDSNISDKNSIGIFNINNNATITGGGHYIGGIVGFIDKLNTSNLKNNGTITGASNVGGIFGYHDGIKNVANNLENNGLIYSKESVGGITSSNDAIINNAINNGNIYSDGELQNNYSSYVGGIVGYNQGTINYSQNNGTIKINKDSNTPFRVGGITGYTGSNAGNNTRYMNGHLNNVKNNKDIAVKGQVTLGGISGVALETTISNSVNNGKMEVITDIPGGDISVGGIVGDIRESKINQTYNSGDVIGANTSNEASNDTFDKIWIHAGGICGETSNDVSSVSNSYNSGNILTYSMSPKNSMNFLGGIFGDTNSSISNSYSIGKISSNDLTFAGILQAGNQIQTGDINNSYWDSEITGLEYSLRGGSAKTTKQMKQKSTFKDWDFKKVWRIDEGNDYPRLRELTEGTIVITPSKPKKEPASPSKGNPTEKPTNSTKMSIKANDLSKTYDGKAVNTQADLEKLEGWNGTGISTEGLLDNDKLTDKKIFTGNLRFDGKGSNWQGAKDAGNYTIVPTGLGSQKYEIKFAKGDLNIKPKTLTVQGERRYDSTTSVDAKEIKKINGIVKGDEKLKITGKGELFFEDVGIQHLGSNQFKINQPFAKNYVIANDGSTWKIDKAKITIEPTPTNSKLGIKANDLSKTYDGKAVNTQADLEKLEGWKGTGVSATGLLDGDKLTDKKVFTGKLRFDGKGSNWKGAKNAGQYYIVPTGLDSNKYEIKFAKGNLKINPATLIVKGKRTYDATNKVSADEIVDVQGLADVDKDKRKFIAGTATLSSKNVGKQQLTSNDFHFTDMKYDEKDNYNFSNLSFWNIGKKTIYPEGDHVYNGKAKADSSGIIFYYSKNKYGDDSSKYDKDEVYMIGSGVLDSRNAGTRTLLSNTFKLAGKDSKNYQFSPLKKWTIKPMNVRINAKYDEKFYDGTTKSFKKPEIDVIDFIKGDKITAEQAFESPKAGRMLEAILKPVNIKIKDGNNGKNYDVMTETHKGTIFPTEYKKYALSKQETKELVAKNPLYRDRDIIFRKYTPTQLQSMSQEQLLEIERFMIRAGKDDVHAERISNLHKLQEEFDKLSEREMNELYGFLAPYGVPLGGKMGEAEIKALFSKKGGAFALKTVSNMVTTVAIVKTGGALDFKSSISDTTLDQLATLGSSQEFTRFISLASNALNDSTSGVVHDSVFAGIEVSGILDSDTKAVVETFIKVMTLMPELLYENDEFDLDLKIKLAGIYADIVGEFVPNSGVIKGASKYLAVLADQYDNANQFSEYTGEVFDDLAKPVAEFYNNERDSLFKEKTIENILLLQKENPSQFH